VARAASTVAGAGEDWGWRRPMGPAGVSMVATTPSARAASLAAPGAALATRVAPGPGTTVRSMSCQPLASWKRTGPAERTEVREPSRLATTFLVGVVSESTVTERSRS